MVGSIWVSDFTPMMKGPIMISIGGAVYFAYSRCLGPMVIFPDGRSLYTNQQGCYHRTDGPAVIDSDSSKEYWVNGDCLPLVEFFLTYGVV